MDALAHDDNAVVIWKSWMIADEVTDENKQTKHVVGPTHHLQRNKVILLGQVNDRGNRTVKKGNAI